MMRIKISKDYQKNHKCVFIFSVQAERLPWGEDYIHSRRTLKSPKSLCRYKMNSLGVKITYELQFMHGLCNPFKPKKSSLL